MPTSYKYGQYINEGNPVWEYNTTGDTLAIGGSNAVTITNLTATNLTSTAANITASALSTGAMTLSGSGGTALKVYDTYNGAAYYISVSGGTIKVTAV
jgi:hypothetical protein